MAISTVIMRSPVMLVSSRQIRAARGLLGWTRTRLGDEAIVSTTSVADYERGDVNPRAATLDAMVVALEKAGVEFLWPDADGIGEGVRLKIAPEAQARKR